MNCTRFLAQVLGTALVLLAAAGRAAATDSAAAVSEPKPSSVVGTTAPDANEARDGGVPEFAWSATYASRYSFQGLDYSDGKPVLQPSGSASFRGLSASFWANVDQTRGQFNEVDLTLQQEFGRGIASGALGYGHLRYPNRPDWAPTHEVYLDLALEAPLAPSLSVHWDVDAGAGRYWTLALGREFEIAPVTAALSANLYAHEHYYGMSGVPSFETGLAVTAGWGPFELQPAVARQWAWENGDFRDDLAIEPGWLVSVGVAPR